MPRGPRSGPIPAGSEATSGADRPPPGGPARQQARTDAGFRGGLPRKGGAKMAAGHDGERNAAKPTRARRDRMTHNQTTGRRFR